MLKKTPLHGEHLKLKAKMSEFGGYDMPIQYTSILDEHKAVRTNVGIFDVSHMGEILVEGDEAEEFLNSILTNDLRKLKVGKVQYTILVQDDGGTIDDLIVYKMKEDSFLLVVNAANSDKDFDYISKVKSSNLNAKVEDVSENYGLVAIQGPKSVDYIEKLLGTEVGNIEAFSFEIVDYKQDDLIVSRTGYTGEDGFEIYGPPERIKEIFVDAVDTGVVPCGLGARDTLRFEAGLPLYGNELGPDISPIEAGLGFFVKFNKDFTGKDVLKKQKEEKLGRRLIGLKLLKKGMPRTGYEVYYDGKKVGKVTSGGYAPNIDEYIAFALVELPEKYKEKGKIPNGEQFEIKVRKRMLPAEKTSRNFLKALS